MKKIFLFLILSVTLGAVVAQESLDLFTLFEQARQNHPLQKQSALYDQQSVLNKEALQTNFYPKLDLNAQASYQSDVTEVDISVPGISLPTMNKDQYKLNLDASQLIYDGGLVKQQQRLEELKTIASKTGVEVELYKLFDQVNNAFFGIMLIDENTKLLDESLREIKKRIDVAQAAVNNGVMKRNDLDKLRAAKLELEKQQIELEYQRIALVETLSELTGKEYLKDVRISPPKEFTSTSSNLTRPEHKQFESLQSLNQAQIELQQKTRSPKVFAFAQAGYGKPGYNMFSEDFDNYYMLGVKLSWNIYDWGQTRKTQNALAIEQNIINHKKEAFDLSLSVANTRYQTDLEKINQLMETEAEVVKMKNDILQRTSKELDQGTISSTDYLSDLVAHTQASIRLNSYMIQKLQTQYRMMILTGGISSQLAVSSQQ